VEVFLGGGLGDGISGGKQRDDAVLLRRQGGVGGIVFGDHELFS
jgi:hypothetical protein